MFQCGILLLRPREILNLHFSNQHFAEFRNSYISKVNGHKDLMRQALSQLQRIKWFRDLYEVEVGFLSLRTHLIEGNDTNSKCDGCWKPTFTSFLISNRNTSNHTSHFKSMYIYVIVLECDTAQDYITIGDKVEKEEVFAMVCASAPGSTLE